MKLAMLMLAAMLPLSACIVVPDHDRDRPHVEGNCDGSAMNNFPPPAPEG